MLFLASISKRFNANSSHVWITRSRTMSVQTNAATLRTQALTRLQDWLNRSGDCPLQWASDASVADKSALIVTHDPATNKPLVQYRATASKPLDAIMQSANLAQRQWCQVPPLERSKRLNLLADLVRAESQWLAELEVLDTGKPFWEATADVEACADTITLFAGFVPTLGGTHVPCPPNPASFYYTRREPFGVCAGIGAWNFPFQMAVWKSAPAIAAGNAMVFKPSPLTPLTAVRLSELYVEAGFPKGLFSIVLGETDVGQALVKHSSVNKISFTGSVGGGRGVLTSAADRIVPATVELGGKSALLILADADLDEAVKGTLMANFYTQGQVCSNAARVFVHRSIFDQFRDKLCAAVQALRVGDPFDPTTCIGALISPEHTTKVRDFITSAVSEGAVICTGGSEPPCLPPSEGALDQTKFITPCVLTNCHDDMLAVREEIFGPVVTLLVFDSEEEAIRRANNSPLGLAGGVFTRDLNKAHRVAAELECGSVYVNSYNNYPPGIPFGGYKQSGYGRENCIETLHAYTQIKAVYIEGGSIPDPFPQ